jgi:hypothetical protein
MKPTIGRIVQSAVNLDRTSRSPAGKPREGRGGGLGTVLSQHARNKTGVVGISIVTTAKKNKTHKRTYFSVHMRFPDGKTQNRRFCMETLGRHEAWRRALNLRQDHERRLTGWGRL